VNRPLTLTTVDGIRLAVRHDAGPRRLAFVVAHGFTGSSATPGLRAVREVLRQYGGVIAVDMRGHGASGGESTLGDLEVHDVAAAVILARDLGYAHVVTVGFSMGASVVVRQAGTKSAGIDAVVSVSGPAFWYYRGTPAMRWVHRTIGSRFGREIARRARGTRIAATGWAPAPEPPAAMAPRIAPTPFLIVHGDQDGYFPLEHADRLYAAASQPVGARAELWVEPSFGHAESAISANLVHRIADWAAAAVS
jgi:pimeloyl-ACP methyl ester carboxylesterase